jgi:DNA-binding response OmpR family regulator
VLLEPGDGSVAADVESASARPSVARVLLVEPNVPLREAIVAVLAAEAYEVEPCASLEQVLVRTDGQTRDVALVAWQSMEGLLAEEHRQHLGELTNKLRVVLMVPRRWARLLERTDLGAYVAGLVAKPFEADELLLTLQRALG